MLPLVVAITVDFPELDLPKSLVMSTVIVSHGGSPLITIHKPFQGVCMKNVEFKLNGPILSHGDAPGLTPPGNGNYCMRSSILA